MNRNDLEIKTPFARLRAETGIKSIRESTSFRPPPLRSKGGFKALPLKANS